MHRHHRTVFACPRFAAGISVLKGQRLLAGVALCLGLLALDSSAQIDDSAKVALPPGTPRLEDLIKTPIVTTPSKFEQKTTEAPSSVTVVTADDIRKYGYRTLADLLRAVPGLYVSYDHNYSYLGFRGFNRGDINNPNNRVLLLVDGHRINNDLTDGAYLGTAFILNVDLIERVEIIEGPGSVLYGNNAFFGVINVVTKNGRQYQYGEASGEAASYDTYKGRVTVGHWWTNGWELLLSGTLYDSEGPNLGVPRLDDDSYGSFFGKVRYRDLTLEGAFIRRDKGNPTSLFLAPPGDPRLRTVDDRGFVNLKYNHDFTDVMEVTAQIYYDRNDFTLDVPNGPGFTSQWLREGEWWGAELQLTKRLFERHTFTLGAEYRDDFRQNWEIPNVTNWFGKTSNHGVYLQGDFGVLTNLHLSAGIRYDQYGDLEPTWNPRLALIWNPYRRATIKAIYGTAFRAPSFVEPIIAYSGSELMPETIKTYELIYEQGLGRHVRASVTGFYNRIDGLIVFSETARNENQDVEALGVETALEGVWANGLRGRISYTYAQARDRDTHRILPDSPQHLAKANLIVPLYQDKVFAGLEYQYTSTRSTLKLLNGGPYTVPGEDAPDYGVFNVTLFSQNLLKGLEVSASVYNLLDKRYADPATAHHEQDLIYQNGRTFQVKLLYRF